MGCDEQKSRKSESLHCQMSELCPSAKNKAAMAELQTSFERTLEQHYSLFREAENKANEANDELEKSFIDLEGAQLIKLTIDGGLKNLNESLAKTSTTITTAERNIDDKQKRYKELHDQWEALCEAEMTKIKAREITKKEFDLRWEELCVPIEAEFEQVKVEIAKLGESLTTLEEERSRYTLLIEGEQTKLTAQEDIVKQMFDNIALLKGQVTAKLAALRACAAPADAAEQVLAIAEENAELRAEIARLKAEARNPQ